MTTEPRTSALQTTGSRLETTESTTDMTTPTHGTTLRQQSTVKTTNPPTSTLTSKQTTSAVTSKQQTSQITSTAPTTEKPKSTAPAMTTQKQSTPTAAPTERSTTKHRTTLFSSYPSTVRRTTTNRQHTTTKTAKTDATTKVTTKHQVSSTTHAETSTEAMPGGSTGTANVALAITLSLLLLAMIAIVILAILYFRRRHTDSGDVNIEEPPEVVHNNNENLRRSMHFNRGNLALGDIIGRGSFTQVMTGQAWKVKEGEMVSTVAIKMLRDDAREIDKSRLIAELETMRKLLDPPRNIISLLGYCKEEDPVYIMYEYAERGSLQSYLREIREEYYSDNNTGERSKFAQILIRFIDEIGHGLGYLHFVNVAHGDLCSLSILITEDLVIKISDIGKQPTSKSGKYSTLGKASLPVRWMAPETHRGDFSTKADIWAFGVVMWELATLGATPYFTLSWGEEVTYYVKNGGRLEKPDHCSQELYNMMIRCWTDDPKQRPACRVLLRKVQQFIGNEADQLNMNECNPNLYEIIKSSSREEKF